MRQADTRAHWAGLINIGRQHDPPSFLEATKAAQTQGFKFTTRPRLGEAQISIDKVKKDGQQTRAGIDNKLAIYGLDKTTVKQALSKANSLRVAMQRHAWELVAEVQLTTI